jgi:hypothetical protein
LGHSASLKLLLKPPHWADGVAVVVERLPNPLPPHTRS